MIAMVGLVLDGGDTFAQRRDQQNGADLAAIAGANAYMNAPGGVAAKQAAAGGAAVAVATRNGYTSGQAGTSVTVDVSLLSTGARVKVDVTSPHANTFARVMGFNTWDVSVTATAIAGTIDTGVGAAPWTMDIAAFNPDGTPKYTAANPQDFGEANGDYPVSALDIAWTDFNGNNNVNTAEVRGIIDGSNVVTATIGFEQYIGQHNQGNHTALYGDVNQHLAGHDVPVPIVGSGNPDVLRRRMPTRTAASRAGRCSTSSARAAGAARRSGATSSTASSRPRSRWASARPSSRRRAAAASSRRARSARTRSA